MNNTGIEIKKKRKTRSDKGKKRKFSENTKTISVQMTAEAKQEIAVTKAKYVMFDESKISNNWYMQVWPCWCNLKKYEILFVFDGVRYGYKQTFTDPTIAYTLGEQYLQYRYKNKTKYNDL